MTQSCLLRLEIPYFVYLSSWIRYLRWRHMATLDARTDWKRQNRVAKWSSSPNRTDEMIERWLNLISNPADRHSLAGESRNFILHAMIWASWARCPRRKLQSESLEKGGWRAGNGQFVFRLTESELLGSVSVGHLVAFGRERYSHCLITISSSSSRSGGTGGKTVDLLRIPPATLQAIMMTETEQTTTTMTMAMMMMMGFYLLLPMNGCCGCSLPEPLFRVFSRFLLLFHNFYCGIHFTNSFSRAPPET